MFPLVRPSSYMKPNLSQQSPDFAGVNLNVDQVKVEYCRKVGPPSTSTASREETGSPTVELEFTEADLALATIPGNARAPQPKPNLLQV